jgi:uncharacterized protein YdeI (YjbR/CyaY-like superfamily)
MRAVKKLYVTNRDDWRAWLERHWDAEKEVWLIFYKRHTGKPSLNYDDAVEEALCFGWIDSIIRKLDDEKFARKFTPRKAESKWSELNKKRAHKMVKEGKMTQAGLKNITEAKKSGEWFRSPSPRTNLAPPSYMIEAFAANKKARENFAKLAKSYQRHYIGWITSAKKQETRKRRLAEAIRLLEKNEKLGMK